jgi:hypothetical protein
MAPAASTNAATRRSEARPEADPLHPRTTQVQAIEMRELWV